MWFFTHILILFSPNFFTLPELVLPFQDTGRAGGIWLRQENWDRCGVSLPITGDWALAATHTEREQFGRGWFPQRFTTFSFLWNLTQFVAHPVEFELELMWFVLSLYRRSLGENEDQTLCGCSRCRRRSSPSVWDPGGIWEVYLQFARKAGIWCHKATQELVPDLSICHQVSLILIISNCVASSELRSYI